MVGAAAAEFEAAAIAAAQAAAVARNAAAGFRSVHAASAAAQAAAAAHRLETKLYGTGASSSAGPASGRGRHSGSRADEAAGVHKSRPLAAEMPAGPTAEPSPYHTSSAPCGSTPVLLDLETVSAGYCGGPKSGGSSQRSLGARRLLT